MADIDSIVDKSLAKSRPAVEEPNHVLVHRWFKTWKMFKYETSTELEAYDKFNEVMKQLMKLSNVLIDSRKSRVYLKDMTVFHDFTTLKYTVEVYWRDAQ